MDVKRVSSKAFDALITRPFCGFFGKHKFVLDMSKPRGYGGAPGGFRWLQFEAKCLRCAKTVKMSRDGFPYSTKPFVIGEMPKPPKPPKPRG